MPVMDDSDRKQMTERLMEAFSDREFAVKVADTADIGEAQRLLNAKGLYLTLAQVEKVRKLAAALSKD